AVLSIMSYNPDLRKVFDPERRSKASKAHAEAVKSFCQYSMNDKITWSIIAIPYSNWAQIVFPDKPKEEAVKRLWDAIVKSVRVDKDDPVAAWEKHNATLETAREVLNAKKYKKLLFKAPGTDLELALPEGHIWKGGSAKSE